MQVVNSQPNLAPNGGFHFWQAIEGTATDVTTGNSTYGPDWWYLKNGSGDTCTISRQTAVVNGGTYGCKAIYKAATTPTSNGLELYYILPNLYSAQFYNVPLSLSIWGIAFGLTTQIGVQFYAKTTEAKLDTAVGPEAVLAVNTTTAAQITLSNQTLTSQLGTAPNVAGCFGVRIRCLAASSGNVYAASNGFQVEQLMLISGPVASRQFSRFGGAPGAEYDVVATTYEKNFPLGTAPIQNAGAADYNLAVFSGTGVTNTEGATVRYRVPKRAAGTITSYNPAASNANWRDTTNSADRTVTVGAATLEGFQISLASGAAASTNVINWSVDATI
jgi:hypothetical protein